LRFDRDRAPVLGFCRVLEFAHLVVEAAEIRGDPECARRQFRGTLEAAHRFVVLPELALRAREELPGTRILRRRFGPVLRVVRARHASP
jgi:hypothetical protein